MLVGRLPGSFCFTAPSDRTAKLGAMDLHPLQKDLETVSQIYARKFGIERTDDWLLLKLNEEVGELTRAYLAIQGRSRDDGRSHAERTSDFGAELADVVAHALLLAERFNVDMADELTRKWLVWKQGG